MLPLPLALLLLAASARAEAPVGVQEGVALFRARHAAEACVVLHLAAAERELRVLAEAGAEDPCFIYALPGLLDIARQTGDESTLREVAPRYLEVDLPPAVAAEVRLQQGLAAWRAGQRRQAADLLEGVPEDTPAYARAALVLGLVLEEGKSAVRAYYKAVQAAGQDADGGEIASLATLEVARIYEEIGRLDEAEHYAGLVTRSSAAWPEALTVLGRIALTRGDPWTALDRLAAATSPFVRADRLMLEAELLHAEALATVCRRDEAATGLARLQARVGPQHAELSAFVAAHRAPSGAWLDPAGAWAAYFEGFPEGSALTRALFVEVLRADPDLVAALRRLTLIETERIALAAQPATWQAELSPDLRAALDADEAATRARAGVLLLDAFEAQRTAIDALEPRIEAARARLDGPCTPPAPGPASSDAWNAPWQPTAPATTWPFAGEIWSDELEPWVGEGR